MEKKVWHRSIAGLIISFTPDKSGFEKWRNVECMLKKTLSSY